MSSVFLPPSSELISDLIAAGKSRLHSRGLRLQPSLFFLTLQLDSPDILGWLKAASIFPRFYWKNREGTFEYGGIGDTLTDNSWKYSDLSQQIGELRKLLSDSEAPDLAQAFVSRAFDPDTEIDAHWIEFPRECIRLPELSIIKQGDQSTALIALLSDNEVSPELLNRILILIKTLERGLPVEVSAVRPVIRRDTPGQARWQEMVRSAVSSINSDQIEKIVLARRTDFGLQKQPDAIDLLSQLSTRATNSYIIMYSPTPDSAFVSISPERLLRCQGRTLSTEAVAGTVSRGQSEIEDLALENRLRNSLKDRSEQQFVVDDIARSLSPFCDKVEVSNAASVMKLQRVQHLISEFRAILKADTKLDEVFSALHPTAAVCGTPREETRRMLAELEQFDRGWYAGAIGLVGADQAEFAVGIRSALLRGQTLSVFTGAGIVGQSDPAVEWQELEEKLQSILSPQFEDAS